MLQVPASAVSLLSVGTIPAMEKLKGLRCQNVPPPLSIPVKSDAWGCDLTRRVMESEKPG